MIVTPWGMASSASSTRTVNEWFPQVSMIDVGWVRTFAEWGSIEPTQGAMNFDQTDALLKSANRHQLQVSGLFFGSPKWAAPSSHTFAMDHLAEWGNNYANALTAHYKGRIHYWEVWNEGNAGFNDGHNNTTDYARLVSAAYEGAKKADPDAQVGLSVASFDAPYIGQVALAQAAAGKPAQFDYLCIHPYETLGGISQPDGEILYLWMNKMLRDELKATAPDRANVPIWITEVSRRVDAKTTEDEAARTLIKAYVMAIAQGIAVTCWFEAKDPVGEEDGFGLIRRDGTLRPSYTALKSLIAALGRMPKYLGWVSFGVDGKTYDFLFEGMNGPILVLWAPAGVPDQFINFGCEVQVIDPLTGNATKLNAMEPLKLGNAPLLVTGIKSDFIATAQMNAAKPFPYGGNYSTASTVGLELGATPKSSGLFQVHPATSTIHTFDDGSSGIEVPGDYTHPVSFYTHPSFASVMTRDYYIRLTYRRIAPGNVGWNFHYEVADSQGKGPMRSNGGWFSAGPDMGWQTHVWHVTDASFAKMWGYDFSINPEKSVPFVIGKVEVSTQPLK